MRDSNSNVVLLTGGLGGARLAPCLRDALGPGRLTVIANVGDDLSWHGLRVCPDLDSVTYALAGVWDSERGWGLREETFRVRDEIVALGAAVWFNVGDKDLAHHLLRGDRLREGHSLTDATRELSRRLGVEDVEVLPASDEPCETHMLLEDGRLLHFQEWYVGERAKPELREVRLAGGKASRAAIEAIRMADAVILGPSNPVTSIGAILALDGVEEAVKSAPRRISVSPVVAGVGSENPGVHHHALARRRVLSTIKRADDSGSIAGLHAGLTETFLLDEADAKYEKEVRRAGLEPVFANLLDAKSLAGKLDHICR
ncbi:MAG: 2-phospho-L-lactate transferase CofD family protein, partial [Rubrobacteraceae bacterium]